MKYGITIGPWVDFGGRPGRLGVVLGLLVWGGGLTILFVDHHWVFSLMRSMSLIVLHELPLAVWLAGMGAVGGWFALLGLVWRRTRSDYPRGIS